MILIEFASLSDIALLTFERITAGLAKYNTNFELFNKKMGTLGLEPRSAGFSRENRLEPAMIAATLCPRIT